MTVKPCKEDSMMKCLKCARPVPSGCDGHVHFSFEGQEGDFCSSCFDELWRPNGSSRNVADWICKHKAEQQELDKTEIKRVSDALRCIQGHVACMHELIAENSWREVRTEARFAAEDAKRIEDRMQAAIERKTHDC